ncbi:ATP dependent dna ligase domain protein [Colletotrichum musicola]|uniref:ATP dependent dna ligase domain protein n=1 Tax=Colletotrichum musicola TaxID=2175873 RepID=A0A8H6K394_9PEZI|nr:ATP dependent dna ligase domain protein [Colletotrichum musicola]
MPIPFVLLCDLLEQAHKKCKSGDENINQCVRDWFAQHRRRVDHPDTDVAALFSALLPDKRTDRVYGIQATRLSNIVARAAGIGQTRIAELRRFERPGLGLDLADCIANILKETASHISICKDHVTVEEIDAILNSLAAGCRFSSPAVQASEPPRTSANRESLLVNLYRRLQYREAKWLSRMILKNYQPVMFEPANVYYCYDPLLPKILRVQDDFTAALALLKKLNSDPALRSGTGRRADLMKHLTPVLGVKVGRQFWLKGRSIKHCMTMSHGRMSCEKKVDGEYCQIHVDLSKGFRCIQIFSKSGKDSTADRSGLHGAIRDSLRIGKPDCKFSKGCILEGELVVYSDKENKILPFHKIRKYVSRSGSFLHTEADSQRRHYEHLMIVYFDVLLIDGESLLGVRHSERFKRLTNLVNCREGHSELVERQVISLDQPLAASHLRKAFAKSIVARDEGLVLKPDDPYFDFSQARRAFSCCPIKLKKEYIGSFGDVGDFAVVGARYDPDKAKCYRIPNLKWTHFYLGCLDNKEDVHRFQAKPEFTVVHQVELNETLLKTILTYGRPMPVEFEDNDVLVLKIAPGIAQQKMPTVVFTEPLVFDIRCFSFDQMGNTGFWQPRFPQVSKVHFDRSFIDTISFSELQKVAQEATTAPALEDSQEMLNWIAALEGTDPRGIPIDAISQSNTTSLMTPSRTSSVRPSTSPAPCFSSPLMARRSLPALLKAPEPALITPPTSSAPEVVASKPADEPVDVNEPSSAGKRAQEMASPSSRESKRPRVDFEIDANDAKLSATQARKPLADVSINQASHSNPASQAQTGSGNNIQMAASSCKPTPLAANDVENSNAENIPNIVEPTVEPPQTASPDASAKHTCQHAGNNCILAGRVAILSLCIAHQPWITENLLPSHGIQTLTSHSDDPAPPTSGSRSDPRRSRVRKICFVEHNRKEATRTFMRQLLENPNYTPSGRREWIEVYDWRLLEDVTALEKVLKGSKPLAQHPDPKRKWYVGLV